MRFLCFFILLSILAANAFAYTVAIKVVVAQDTYAVGTNITIVKDGLELHRAKADLKGQAVFELDRGSYFIYLERGGYPRHVQLLQVSGNVNVTYVLRQQVLSGGIYGRVVGPSDFSGTSIMAYFEGKPFRKVFPNSDGYYQIPYLSDGEYELIFKSEGFEDVRKKADVRAPSLLEIDAKMEPAKVVLEGVEGVEIVAPSFAKLKEKIEVLFYGRGVPLAGREVFVITPSGEVAVRTGERGEAAINAAKPGSYVFYYGNASVSVLVEGLEEEGAAAQEAQKKEEERQSQAQFPPQGEPPAIEEEAALQDNYMAIAMLLFGLGAVIFAIGIMLYLASKSPSANKKLRGEEKKVAKEAEKMKKKRRRAK